MVALSKYDEEKEWDKRAKLDAPFYVSGDSNVDMGDYLAEGRKHAFGLTADFFREQGFDPRTKRMLDIGCGIGRHAAGFAEMFDKVVGTDVSAEMINKARKLNTHLRNAEFVKNSGCDLGIFPNEYFDFVFSYWVFPHVHEKRVISGYLGEIHRVLRREGLMRIVLGRRGFVPIFGFLPIPRLLADYAPSRLVELYTFVNSILRKNPRYAGVCMKFELGAAFTEAEVRHMVASAGLTLLSVQKIPWAFWVCGKKD